MSGLELTYKIANLIEIRLEWGSNDTNVGYRFSIKSVIPTKHEFRVKGGKWDKRVGF